MDVLVLGGTGLAGKLSARLVEQQVDVVTSIAGRTTAPSRLPGKVRVGGFGGGGRAAHLPAHRERRIGG